MAPQVGVELDIDPWRSPSRGWLCYLRRSIVKVNIAIMRVFVKLREVLATHKELAQKLAELEMHLHDHDQKIEVIFDAIHRLISHPEGPRKKIGFEVKEPGIRYGKKAKKKSSPGD